MPDRPPPTRIGFNAALMSPARDFRAAGLHRYIVALLSALAAVDGVRIEAFVPASVPAGRRAGVPSGAADGLPAGQRAGLSDGAADALPERLPEAIRVRPVPGAVRRPTARIVWEQAVLPALLAGGRSHVFHGPAYAMPLACPCPAVVTVHDLSFVRLPDAHPPARRFYLRAATRLSARRARALVAVSAFTARELVAWLGIDPARVRVIPNGVDARFQPPAGADRAAVRERLGLPDRFVLTVATLEPRKNLSLLLEAYAQLAARTADPPALAVAGAAGWGGVDPGRVAARLGIAEHVHLLGYVARDDLPALYGAAELFVYPSRYEGFGLPALEAMACGVAVAVADAASLSEVVGDAGEVVSGGSAEAWAGALAALLADPARRRALAERGLARARRFSWPAAAEATAAVYREAHQGRAERVEGATTGATTHGQR